jgi:hypothetical protein
MHYAAKAFKKPVYVAVMLDKPVKSRKRKLHAGEARHTKKKAA